MVVKNENGKKPPVLFSPFLSIPAAQSVSNSLKRRDLLVQKGFRDSIAKISKAGGGEAANHLKFSTKALASILSPYMYLGASSSNQVVRLILKLGQYRQNRNPLEVRGNEDGRASSFVNETLFSLTM